MIISKIQTERRWVNEITYKFLVPSSEAFPSSEETPSSESFSLIATSPKMCD